MKLRLQGNSLRLRLSRTEVERLRQECILEETVYFGPSVDARLTYALGWNRSISTPEVQCSPQRITVWMPEAEAIRWFDTDQVGMEAEIALGTHGSLSVLVEKDFACLDRSAEENADAFPNPLAARAC